MNTTIVSASYDGTARIWNIEDLLKEKISNGIDDVSDVSSQSSSVFMSSLPTTPDDRYQGRERREIIRSEKLSSSDTIDVTAPNPKTNHVTQYS